MGQGEAGGFIGRGKTAWQCLGLVLDSRSGVQKG